MTPLDDIYEVFLSLIDDDLITIMLQDDNEEDIADLFMVYLKGAIGEFKKLCDKDLSIDKRAQCIVGVLDDEEVMILALGMIKYWLKPKILRESNIKLMYSDTNFNQKSPAALLEQLKDLKKNSEREFQQRCVDYTYNNGDIGWY